MSSSKKIWAGLGILAILGSLAFLIAGGLKENVVYFLTPSELLARGSEVVDQPLRLGGQVKPGSLQWDAAAMDLRFVVQDSLTEVQVRSTGAPPSMFQEGAGVIMEGHYRADGTFESTNVMVKHSNEYEAPHEGESPEKMYESLIKPGDE
jgi:cytochrome c-type biogenesis protein CcmE